jgi:hypothetical protein
LCESLYGSSEHESSLGSSLVESPLHGPGLTVAPGVVSAGGGALGFDAAVVVAGGVAVFGFDTAVVALRRMLLRCPLAADSAAAASVIAAR